MLWGFCPARFGVLFCSVVLGCWYLKLLDCVVSGACFLAGGLLECDLAHHLSVAVLCMLYKIRCYPMHPLMVLYRCRMCHGVRVTRVALVAHRYTYAPTRCRTLQYCRTFIPLAVSLWKDGPALWKSRAMPFYWPNCTLPFVSSTVFHFSSFLLWVGIVGLGSLDWEGVNHSLPALCCWPFLIIIIIIIEVK